VLLRKIKKVIRLSIRTACLRSLSFASGLWYQVLGGFVTVGKITEAKPRLRSLERFRLDKVILDSKKTPSP